MTYDAAALGRRIALRRGELEISQEDMATDLGMSRPGISKIERGVSEPKISTLMVIADYLSCSLDYLLGTEKPATSEDDELMKLVMDLRNRSVTTKKQCINVLKALMAG